MQPPSQIAGINLGNWGKYPEGYDRAVHGRYNPAKYYGKPDVPFGEVKLCEIPSWIGRRNIGLTSFGQMIGRAYWRWQQAYVLPKYSGIAPFFQVAVGCMMVFYVINYPRLKVHKNYKYH
ncbi:hypothetical protein PV327_001970 [Microctonus hyperodae]|uniref:ATP synthase subunit f, mitochondrial n=1 Tax=Microctonus hyperodae TaxID=165561 RepID=A0AA39FF03_MICHY|nr:hypothetical protein PV327_001970 [Microctonus hyperodae]